MRAKFTDHAIKRMRERGLTKKFIKDSVAAPDKVEISSKDRERFLIKKAYYNRTLKREHLLMVIAEQKQHMLVIVTIIDTSKIRKYMQ